MKIKIVDAPSDSMVNTTLKPIDREDSNAELEKKEIVFNPDKLTLHTVLGKRHNAGGTPVKLDKDTFIFSDFNKLKINKKIAEEMKFKGPGTPAGILKKEVDIKHHNRMVDIIENQKGDEVTQNSANLMIEKNLKKIGQVAAVQENKKGQDGQQPEFSKGTGPVNTPELNNRIMQSKQYAKGGKFFDGGYFECPYGRLPNGQCKEAPDGADLAKLRNLQAKQLATAPVGSNYIGYDADNRNTYYSQSAGNVQRTIVPRGGPQMSNAQWKEYLRTESPERKARRLAGTSSTVNDNFFVVPQRRILGTNPMTGAPTPHPVLPDVIGEDPVDTTPVAPAIPKLPIIGEDVKIGLTDWQKLDLGRQAIGALGIKRYDPIRQQQESVITRPELYSAQPYLNQINQTMFNSSRGLNTLTNPSQLMAANSQLFGAALDQKNSAIGNIENQNVPLLNEFKAKYGQLLDSDAQQNRKFDQDYYNNTILSRQNYNNLKDIATDNLFNGFNETMNEAQTMENLLNSQQKVATDIPIKDKQGNIIGYKGQLPIMPKKGFFGWGTRANNRMTAEALLNFNVGRNNTDPAAQESAFKQWKAEIDAMPEGQQKNALMGAYWVQKLKAMGITTSSTSNTKITRK